MRIDGMLSSIVKPIDEQCPIVANSVIITGDEEDKGIEIDVAEMLGIGMALDMMA